MQGVSKTDMAEAASDPASKAECDICTEPYTAVRRFKVTCPVCRASACAECCMSALCIRPGCTCFSHTCNAPWSRDFIRLTFSDAFLNGRFRTKETAALLEEHRALLPRAQQRVEAKSRRRVLTAQWTALVAHRRKLRTKRDTAVPGAAAEKARAKLAETSAQLEEAETQLAEVEAELAELSETAAQPDKTRAAFLMCCPKVGCSGFLSSAYKCGVCEGRTCPQCRQLIAAEGHACAADDVASVAELKRESKACPGCGTAISKIDGCDQMWCVACKTAFSWRTRRISTGVIHNPHFIHWARANSVHIEFGARRREDAANEGRGGACQELVRQATFRVLNDFKWTFLRWPLAADILTSVLRMLDEMEAECAGLAAPRWRRRYMMPYDMPLERQRADQYAVIHEQRVVGKITNDEEFARRLFLNKRNFDYEEELMAVRRLFITAANDVVVLAQHAHVALLTEMMPANVGLFMSVNNGRTCFGALHREYTQQPEVFCAMEALLMANVRELLNNVAALAQYSNECLARIGRSYKRVPQRLARFLPLAMARLSTELAPLMAAGSAAAALQ